MRVAIFSIVGIFASKSNLDFFANSIHNYLNKNLGISVDNYYFDYPTITLFQNIEHYIELLYQKFIQIIDFIDYDYIIVLTHSLGGYLFKKCLENILLKPVKIEKISKIKFIFFTLSFPLKINNDFKQKLQTHFNIKIITLCGVLDYMFPLDRYDILTFSDHETILKDPYILYKLFSYIFNELRDYFNLNLNNHLFVIKYFLLNFVNIFVILWIIILFLLFYFYFQLFINVMLFFIFFQLGKFISNFFKLVFSKDFNIFRLALFIFLSLAIDSIFYLFFRVPMFVNYSIKKGINKEGKIENFKLLINNLQEFKEIIVFQIFYNVVSIILGVFGILVNLIL